MTPMEDVMTLTKRERMELQRQGEPETVEPIPRATPV